jgi:hypothetical protein
MLEVKALGVTVAELTSPADTGLLVMASIGLTPEALARIASATLANDLPAATAMRINGPVSIRPESSLLAAYPPSGGDSGAEEVGQILAWPLHGDDGSVLGALSVGLPSLSGHQSSSARFSSPWSSRPDWRGHRRDRGEASRGGAPGRGRARPVPS